MVKYQRKRSTRKRSTLSNYRIATKTNAKAQSRQIYMLKKRVSRIYRLTRPELRVQTRAATAISLTSNASDSVTFPGGTFTAQDIFPFIDTGGSGVSGNTASNLFTRLRGFNLDDYYTQSQG